MASWGVEQLALLASELVKHHQPSPRSHFWCDHHLHQTMAMFSSSHFTLIFILWNINNKQQQGFNDVLPPSHLHLHPAWSAPHTAGAPSSCCPSTRWEYNIENIIDMSRCTWRADNFDQNRYFLGASLTWQARHNKLSAVLIVLWIERQCQLLVRWNMDEVAC